MQGRSCKARTSYNTEKIIFISFSCKDRPGYNRKRASKRSRNRRLYTAPMVIWHGQPRRAGKPWSPGAHKEHQHVQSAQFLRLTRRWWTWNKTRPCPSTLARALYENEPGEENAITESAWDHRMGKFPQLRDFAILQLWPSSSRRRMNYSAKMTRSNT